MKKIAFLFVFVLNYSQATTNPVLVSATITCANKYCMALRGLNFDADASVLVRENSKGSTISVFAGNDIYNRSFTTAEDKIFFPIQNLKLQEKWKKRGLCFRVNNNSRLSKEICNIRTENPTQPAFMGETIESYSAGQDLEHTSFIVRGNASPLEGGNVLKIMGNSWKQINFNYTVTPYSILKFDFRSPQQEAEINGIGFRLGNGSIKHFQVYGTQQTWRNQDYNNYSGTGFKTYEIPVGEYFNFNDNTSGSKDIVKMFFTADEDTHVGQNTIYKNPRLVEQPPLNFECDQSPLPLKIDCPNDEFFSLGWVANNIADPETYANDYQWAADYMDFAYGWYYTDATSRIGIIDAYANLTPENSSKIRRKFSGTFFSKNTLSGGIMCSKPFPWLNYNSMNWEKRADNTINEGLNKTFGKKNNNQNNFFGHPDIFVNEFQTKSNSFELELAVKIGVDISQLSIKIDSVFNLSDVTFHESSTYTLNDIRPLVFNFSDFTLGESSAGYQFYTISNINTNTDFNTNFELRPRTSSIGYEFLIGDNVDFTCDNNILGVCWLQGFRNIVKIDEEIILDFNNLDETYENNNIDPNLLSRHYEVMSCKRYSHYITEGQGNHGGFILSLLGSTSNNNVGLSSFCKECSLSYLDELYHSGGRVGSSINEIERNKMNAYKFAIESGNQILTISQGGGNLNCNNQGNDRLDICDFLELAKQRDVVVIAAAGNHLSNSMQWPASDIEYVIGVAGTNSYGELWQENPCPSTPSTSECGSNFDSVSSIFAAPADDILVHNNIREYNTTTGCVDSNFGSSFDGYQRCSGTSFSAPILASIVAMIRSINPLISVENIKQILWDARVKGLADQRYAIPRANKSVEISLGKSNRSQVVNRLTPMFRLKTRPVNNSVYQNHISYLYTTVPQIAVASIRGKYLMRPSEYTGQIEGRIYYASDTNSPPIGAYPYFKSESYSAMLARSPFYVFGGKRNPFDNTSQDLLPLHHMVRTSLNMLGISCDKLADHAYSTSRQNGFNSTTFCTSRMVRFDYEGIDGYILPSCPNGIDCYENTGNANDLQCLKLRYSVDDNSFGLMMASEVNNGMFQSYGANYKNISGVMVPITGLLGMSNAECLGYVFPNVDSDNDGVIDGMELVLGTDPSKADTDGDGKSDGTEYPLVGIPQSDPLIQD